MGIALRVPTDPFGPKWSQMAILAILAKNSQNRLVLIVHCYHKGVFFGNPIWSFWGPKMVVFGHFRTKIEQALGLISYKGILRNLQN
jgi:hypothetical protein